MRLAMARASSDNLRGVLFGGYIPQIHGGVVEDGGEARGRLQLIHQHAGGSCFPGLCRPTIKDPAVGDPGARVETWGPFSQVVESFFRGAAPPRVTVLRHSSPWC